MSTTTYVFMEKKSIFVVEKGPDPELWHRSIQFT